MHPNYLYQVMHPNYPRFYVADCASHADAEAKARRILPDDNFTTMHAATSTFKDHDDV